MSRLGHLREAAQQREAAKLADRLLLSILCLSSVYLLWSEVRIPSCTVAHQGIGWNLNQVGYLHVMATHVLPQFLAQHMLAPA